MDEFDTAVKLAVYFATAATGVVPDAAGVAAQLGKPEVDVTAAFARLHNRRMLVLKPGKPTEIRMASPFSGTPTPFRVSAGGRRYYANCVWDAYGVAAALHQDAIIDSVDGHTGEPLRLCVQAGRPLPMPSIGHFALPAARWWDDIYET